MRFQRSTDIASGYRFPQSQTKRGVEKLEQFYTFAEPVEIRQFLQNDPVALEILVDALPRIRQCFEFSDLVVSLSRSAESAERDAPELYIRVVTSLDIDTALEQLENFDREWWLDRPPEVRDRICFDVDFA